MSSIPDEVSLVSIQILLHLMRNQMVKQYFILFISSFDFTTMVSIYFTLIVGFHHWIVSCLVGVKKDPRTLYVTIFIANVEKVQHTWNAS